LRLRFTTIKHSGDKKDSLLEASIYYSERILGYRTRLVANHKDEK